MGVLYKFNCVNCGYQSKNVGGVGRGMISMLSTMVCKRCNVLTDVLIAEFERDGRYYSNRLKPSQSCCEICKKADALEVWDRKICPKCNQNIGDGRIDVMWD